MLILPAHSHSTLCHCFREKLSPRGPLFGPDLGFSGVAVISQESAGHGWYILVIVKTGSGQGLEIEPPQWVSGQGKGFF